MVRQLTPLVRFDGYHVLADVTGVPDLFHRIKPTLLGVLPWRWKHPETRVLKPWARAVVTLWVARGRADAGVLAVHDGAHAAPHPGHRLGQRRASSPRCSAAPGPTPTCSRSAARCIAIVAVAFPILATAVILFRLVRKIVGSTWRRTRGPSGTPRAGRPGRRRPGRRPGLGLVAAPRHLPADPALRGRHAGAGRAGAARRRRAPRRPGSSRASAAAWSPAGPTTTPRPTRSTPAARAGAGPPRRRRDRRHGRRRGLRGRRRRRRAGRRHRARPPATAPGADGPAVGVPVQQAARPRGRRQPGDGGQHHRQHHPATTWRSRWSGSRTTPPR